MTAAAAIAALISCTLAVPTTGLPIDVCENAPICDFTGPLTIGGVSTDGNFAPVDCNICGGTCISTDDGRITLPNGLVAIAQTLSVSLS